MKIINCQMCNVEIEYSKNKKYCGGCVKLRIKQKAKEYNQRPEVKLRVKEWWKNNFRSRKEYDKEYDKEKYKEWREKYKIKEYMKIWNQTNSQKRLAYKRTKKARQQRNKNRNLRKKQNPEWDIQEKIRCHLTRVIISYSIKGKIKQSCEYGINYQAIIEHLKPFPKDIENYHIDHIIPLSLFDFNKSEHIKIAFKPENHQWLTIKENLEKHNRLLMPC